jgi:2-oxoglutarate dehydrogenase E2 component (dihydrolipoamide succinyltransferase)
MAQAAGDAVKKDETLLEISTDKVDSEIPSPAAGILVEILVKEQATVAVQTVIAYLETDAATAAAATAPATGSEKAAAPAGPATSPASVRGIPALAKGSPDAVDQAASAQPLGAVLSATPGPVPAKGRFYSPLVLSIARTEDVPMEELERIPGTGEGGRVTKKDILGYVQAKKSGTLPPLSQAGAIAAAAKPAVPRREGDQVIQMTNVQQKMAQHMVNSMQTSRMWLPSMKWI